MLFFIKKGLFCVIGIMIVSTSFCQSLIEIEDQRFEAQMTRDLTTLDELIHNNLFYIHSNAFTETKAAFIENVANGKIVYETMEAESGRNVTFLGKKAAVINGVLHVAGTYDGHAFDIRLLYTSVYVKKRKNWFLLRWQSTKAEK